MNERFMHLQTLAGEKAAGQGRFLAGYARACESDGVKPMIVGVDRAALRANLAIIRGRLGERGLCAVLKGDAYGHGIDIVAPEVVPVCSHVAAVDNYELGTVRGVDPDIPLLRLRVGSEFEIAEAAHKRWRVREMAASIIKLREIDSIAGWLGQRADIHLSLDAAGLGRNGLNISDKGVFEDFLGAALALENIHIASVGCHLPDAGSADPRDPKDSSRAALERFTDALRVLFARFAARGLRLPEVSAFSSASSCAFGDQGDMNLLEQPVFDRIGSSLFGLTVHNRHPEAGTRQVMHAGACVCDVVHRRHGEAIGYEHSYRVEEPEGEMIALLGVGWLSLSRYHQGVGKTQKPAFCMNRFGGRNLFVGRQSMNISTLRSSDCDGRELASGDLLYLTSDHGSPENSPTIARVAEWMGGVQPEFVTSTFGGSASSMRFPF